MRPRRNSAELQIVFRIRDSRALPRLSSLIRRVGRQQQEPRRTGGQESASFVISGRDGRDRRHQSSILRSAG